MSSSPPFPLDLIETQHAWNRTYAAMQRRPVATTALRRQLRQLSTRLATHPYWQTPAGRSPAARVELRRQVRQIEQAEEDLTDQQQRIMTCIRTSLAAHGRPPTLREIGTSVGLSSTGSVSYQLDQMEQLGVIHRADGGKRAIAPRW